VGSGNAGLPDNELAHLLSKTGAALSFAHVSCPLALAIANIRHTKGRSQPGGGGEAPLKRISK